MPCLSCVADSSSCTRREQADPIGAVQKQHEVMEAAGDGGGRSGSAAAAAARGQTNDNRWVPAPAANTARVFPNKLVTGKKASISTRVYSRPTSWWLKDRQPDFEMAVDAANGGQWPPRRGDGLLRARTQPAAGPR